MKKTVKQRETQGLAEKERRRLSDHLSSNEINKLMHDTPDKKEEIELERREAYIERPTLKLLRNLLGNGKKAEILPTYDPASGFRYKVVESVFEENVSQEKAKEFLERLSRLEILKKSFFDTYSACPFCGSTVITLHYLCPKCASRHIAKTGLTEHIPCGNIIERGKYLQGNCPKCGAGLVEGQYRDMGLWYICKECGEKFEHPQLDVICRKCDRNFTIETAAVQEISKYALNPNKEQEIRQNVTSLESISKLLAELNFNIESPGLATGEKSGIQHNFSLLAKKEIGGCENIVAIDHAVEEPEVQASPLILYLYKISEVKVDLPIFVAIPKLSETAKRIAQGYNILIIEGNPQGKNHLDRLNNEIQNRLSERIVEEPKIKHVPPETKQHRSRKKLRKGSSRKSLMKPQLYNPAPTIHPHQEPKLKKPAFIETIKKAIKEKLKNDKEE